MHPKPSKEPSYPLLAKVMIILGNITKERSTGLDFKKVKMIALQQMDEDKQNFIQIKGCGIKSSLPATLVLEPGAQVAF